MIVARATGGSRTRHHLSFPWDIGTGRATTRFQPNVCKKFEKRMEACGKSASTLFLIFEFAGSV
jgi:hypothetical protein